MHILHWKLVPTQNTLGFKAANTFNVTLVCELQKGASKKEKTQTGIKKGTGIALGGSRIRSEESLAMTGF